MRINKNWSPLLENIIWSKENILKITIFQDRTYLQRIFHYSSSRARNTFFLLEVDASFHWFGMRFHPSPRKCSTFFSQECLHFRTLWIFSKTLQHESGSMLLKFTIIIFERKKKSVSGELGFFIEICVHIAQLYYL